MNTIQSIEQLSAQELKAFQWKEIKKALNYLAGKSPFYQQLFAKNQIDIHNISNYDDFTRLPLTTKDDIQQHNDDFICVSRKDIAEYTTTSGTLGQPVHVALTHNDLERLAYNEYLSFQMMGITAEDRVQLLLTLDKQFMAGMAYYSGLRKTGATIIRSGSGNIAGQWAQIQHYQSTGLVAVPSFLLKMMQQKPAIIPKSLKKILAIGEPIRDEHNKPTILAEKINEELGVQLFGTYASTEMQTAFTECTHGCGGHLHPDLIYVELLDEQNQLVAEGEAGELTITTFGITGMPLLRYKTGDIFKINTQRCACGRTTPRLSALLGRKKQMIKLKGTTFYPPALSNLIQEISDIEDFGLSIQKDQWQNDQVTLLLHTQKPTLQVRNQIEALCRQKLRVVPEIVFVNATDMHNFLFPGNNRKPLRVKDFREMP